MKTLKALLLVLAIPCIGFAQQNNYLVNAGNGNGLRFWDASDYYKIHMGTGSEYSFGPVNDYSIKSNMGGGPVGRGWTWGGAGQVPIAALNTAGQMKIASHFESNGNIVSYRASTGYLALSGDLPGYADGIYPTLKTDGPWMHFSVAGKYSAFLGTTNAQFGLVDASGTTRVLLNTAGNSYFASGNVGIGNSNPQARLVVEGEIHVNRNYPYVQLNSTYWGGLGSFIQSGVTNAAGAGGDYTVFYNPTGKAFNFRAGNFDALTISGSGKVGVGTLSPDQKLTVKGKIHAEEVIIDLAVPAPDYVFEQNYPLTPLDEIQAYIAQHKHLPEVPSAKEMEKDGVKLGEMEMILLKKMEEMTLYMLELRKEKNELAEQVKQLTVEVTEMKNKKQ